MDEERVRGEYVSAYCSALANYTPNQEIIEWDVRSSKDLDERDAEYAEHARAFAIDCAEQAVLDFQDFAKSGAARLKKRRRSNSDEEE